MIASSISFFSFFYYYRNGQKSLSCRVRKRNGIRERVTFFKCLSRQRIANSIHNGQWLKFKQNPQKMWSEKSEQEKKKLKQQRNKKKNRKANE